MKKLPVALLSLLAPALGACEATLKLDAAPAGAPDAQAAPTESADGEIIAVSTGRVRGYREGGAVAFKGIPFAQPPVGPLRFAAPQPPRPWQGVRDAGAFGAPCMQKRREGAPAPSEDCLTLNVWAPRAPHGPLPVLVFVHGGFNVAGSSSTGREGHPLYDGALMAERGPAIVVTVNYRVGALGFLAHKALEGPRHGSGNWAYLDQLAALEWVKANAAAFGGDPARLTLFGQSSGAKNVCTLVASPLAVGMFARAILQSGRCVAKDGARPRAEAEASGDGIAQELGCGGKVGQAAAACLRALPAERFADGIKDNIVKGVSRWEPTIDGALLVNTQRMGFGALGHVELLIGSTADEMATLFPAEGLPVPTDDASYKSDLATHFGAANVEAILARYPPTAYASHLRALEAALGDATYVCEGRSLAKAAASLGVPVRRYLFTHALSGKAHANGAGHATDLYFLFRSSAWSYTFWQPDPKEVALSDAMIGYWTRFAATGDPNGAGAIAWPAFAGASEPTLVLDAAISVDPHARTEVCDFWESIGVVSGKKTPLPASPDR